MKNTIVVNLFAGPGTGKSTTAAGVFSLLKLHYVDCELVTEYAKDLTWEEDFGSLTDQHKIASVQKQRIDRIYGKVDYIICDSPFIMGLCYANERYNTKSFREWVYNSFSSYHNANYFLKREKNYNPNGRNQTLEEAKEKDKQILTLLKEYNIKYESIQGNFDAINIIVDQILTNEEKWFEYCIYQKKY